MQFTIMVQIRVKMHNYYTYLYNKAVYEVLEQERGKEEAILFARSATAGGQKFPVHWGGDCWSDYESMEESLRGGLSLTSSSLDSGVMISEDLRASLRILQTLGSIWTSFHTQPSAWEHFLSCAVGI